VSARTEFLSRIELLSGLSHSLLEEIAGRLQAADFPAGAVIFRQGERGDAAYLVVSGELELRVDDRPLLRRHAGECVGEFALIDNAPRSADAVALTHVSLLRWERRDFEQALTRCTDLARSLFRTLTRKLREDIEANVQLQLEKERWEQDMARARETQVSMLPQEDLRLPHTEVSGRCHPAAEVGGDYYDYVRLDDERVGLILCDVTGHGFYPSLLVTMAKAALHTQLPHDPLPARVVAVMRRTLFLFRHQLLMTCCYVLIDPRRQTLTYANAGHPYPYLLPAGERSLQRLEPVEPLLGARQHAAASFSEREVRWRPGDLLVLYSDGLTEARSAEGEMFGHRRLEACVRRHAGESATRARDAILAAVGAHRGSTPLADDLTLVVAKAL